MLIATRDVDCGSTLKKLEVNLEAVMQQDQDQKHLFFKIKTTFLKTIKLLTQDHWRSQKF